LVAPCPARSALRTASAAKSELVRFFDVLITSAPRAKRPGGNATVSRSAVTRVARFRVLRKSAVVVSLAKEIASKARSAAIRDARRASANARISECGPGQGSQAKTRAKARAKTRAKKTAKTRAVVTIKENKY
jgi:hypothetical protein